MVDCKKDVRRSLPTKPGVLQCPRKFPQVEKFNRACKVSNFLPWYCVKKLGKKQQQFFFSSFILWYCKVAIQFTRENLSKKDVWFVFIIYQKAVKNVVSKWISSNLINKIVAETKFLKSNQLYNLHSPI